MSHMIDTSKVAKGAIYSLLRNPWHELGTVVNVPASDPRILEMAGMDFAVDCRPVFTTDADGNPVLVPGKRATIRSDTSAALGIVGDQYKPLQNPMLLDFFRQIAASDAIIETAGVLDQGQRVWALARIPELELALGQDTTKGYLLISNSHDGTTSVRIAPTMVRVVCHNTITMALSGFKGTDIQRSKTRDLKRGFTVRHSAQVESGLSQVADQYESAITGWRALAEQMEALAGMPSTSVGTPVGHTTLAHIQDAAFSVTKESKADEGERAKNIREAREARIAMIRASATCNVPGTAGTVYSDFQAVTQFIDHDMNKHDAARGLFGAGVEQKALALEAALALV